MDCSPTKRAPVLGSIIGLVGGALSASICLVVGSILTGIGWGIIGILVMAGGAIAGIGIFVWGFFFINGPCPYCRSMQLWSRLSDSFTCKTCKKVILIREEKFWPVA